MNPSESTTIEQVLFERMGMSVSDALAAGTDAVDERVAAAAEQGVDVDQRLSNFGELITQLTEPETLAALKTVVKQLPQLAELAKVANEIPNIVATLGDVFDDTQQRLADEGMDVERGMVNGLRAALWLGSQVDQSDLQRLGTLIKSDVLNPNAVAVVENAASSLTHVQEDLCQSASTQRVGLFGLLKALRNPDVQRTLAFATRFGECFGKNLGTNDGSPEPSKSSS